MGEFVKKDSLLISGQNPASSETAAKTFLEELKYK
jgi:putative intracellular protease/amidase